MMLVPQQRYRQAIVKANIIARREMAEFMTGKRVGRSSLAVSLSVGERQ